MCGIAGAMFWRETADARHARAVVAAMTAAMRHRGPDGEGVIEAAAGGSRIALGHRRLAIIDLSPRGAQPMRSATAPVWVTFNGEIYNFTELRRELEAAGRRFDSNSDTEVILQGYEAWGPRVVERLDGMFAFGLYDGRTGELLLARDRLGIKPLYVARTEQHVLFASEIRALLATGLVPARLRPGAVDEYLAYQTTAAPRTLIDGVDELEAGHRLRVDADGRMTSAAYWDFLEACPPVSCSSEREARTEVHERLRRSVQGHLIGDVPVGMFLSGGIDSTALVSLARDAGVTPRTFSVVMPGTEEDEGRYSRLVAERLDCDHTEVTLTEAQLAASVPQALASFDHPTGDGINTFIVSQAVARAGLKVALSGLGGDEIFGGYPSFARLRRLSAYSRLWGRSPRLVRSAAAAAVRSMGRASSTSAKVAAVLESDGSVPRAFPILRQMFARPERAALLGRPPAAADMAAERLAAAHERHADRDLMTFVSYAEATTYMHDALLRDSDQMSMACGLELRVPLLDHHLVEYVVGLPEAIKAPRGLPKRLLVESAGARMPVDVVNRPKRGFVLPFDRWMRGELRGICERQLSRAGLARRAGLDETAVQQVWQDFLAGGGTTWSRPWTLVALGTWLEAQGVSA